MSDDSSSQSYTVKLNNRDECKKLLQQGNIILDKLKVEKEFIKLVELLEYILENDKTPEEENLKYDKVSKCWYKPDTYDETLSYIKTAKCWYEANKNIHITLLQTTIKMNRIQIISWLKKQNTFLTDNIVNILIRKQRLDIIDYLYKLEFIFPDNISVLAAKRGRIDILIWIDVNIPNKKKEKINPEALIIAAKMNKKKTFNWLVYRGYVSADAFNQIAEMENKFRYLIYLYNHGYKGNMEYNILIEEESEKFLNWINNKKSIDYPNHLYKAIQIKDLITIKKYCSKECHLAYREVVKLSDDIIIDICSGTIIVDYLYKQLHKNKKLNLIINKAKIPIDLSDLQPD